MNPYPEGTVEAICWVSTEELSEERVFTQAELVKEYKVSERSIRRWRQRGWLEGTVDRITESAFEEFKRRCKSGELFK